MPKPPALQNPIFVEVLPPKPQPALPKQAPDERGIFLVRRTDDDMAGLHLYMPNDWEIPPPQDEEVLKSSRSKDPDRPTMTPQ